MLYEFAMTPDLFDTQTIVSDNAGTILVELLRGLEENGLLADLNKGRWSTHLTQRVETLNPSLKDKVKTCLSVLESRHRLVRHPKSMSGDPRNDQDWLNLALDSHSRVNFHAIILSQALISDCDRECDALVEFLNSLDSPQWESRRKRTLSLTKSNIDYHAALAQLLRHAKALALIDPWLNSQESRYVETIAIASNTLGQRGHARLQGRIDIHAEAGKQKPINRPISECLSTWEQKLRALIAADGHRFRIFLWESLPGSESMHDRFLLTDQCGVSVPGGLDCRSHSHANRTRWSLLDEDERRELWDEYDPAVSPFKLLDKVEIL